MTIWFNLGAECMNLTLACHWISCVDAKFQVNYFERHDQFGLFSTKLKKKVIFKMYKKCYKNELILNFCLFSDDWGYLD